MILYTLPRLNLNDTVIAQSTVQNWQILDKNSKITLIGSIPTSGHNMRRVLRWRDTGYYWQHPGDGPSSQLALGATPSILQPPPAASVTNTLAALQQLLTLHPWANVQPVKKNVHLNI